jgi:hypothetical protein
MPRVSLAFFATGAVYVLIGVVLGIVMGASGDFKLSPVHAHLNLVGWASMGLMGAFYALAGDRAPSRLAWSNYALMTLAVALMATGLTGYLNGDARLQPVLMAGSIGAAAGMLSFFAAVLMTAARMYGRRPASPLAATLPAE